MWASLLRAAALCLSLAAGPAFASDLADFNAAVETASEHQRVALGYLRTGNNDLASLEIDRMRGAWGALVGRFGPKPPDAFAGNPLYGQVLTDVSMRIVAASLMINSGRPEAAKDSLTAMRDELAQLRRSSGIVVLADCVREANAAMDAFMTYDGRALDWTKAETGFGIAAKASIYGYVLDRCDGMAPEAVKNNPEFRRLVDGAKAGLALVPKAIASRDGNLLHRILIELRSFDNLLAFRFGWRLRQPTVSQQIARLRADSLVSTRRDGKTIYYRLTSEDTRIMIGASDDVFGRHGRKR